MSNEMAEMERVTAELPDGWAGGPVLDFFQLQRGHDLPVQDRKPGDVPIIASNGPVGWHDHSLITGPGVITGRSGTIGNVSYVEGSYWPLNTTLYVRDFKGSDPCFVYYFLQNFPLTDHQSGTGVPTLNRNVVHAVRTAFPPLHEQRRIAEVLRSVDEAIAANEVALTSYRTLVGKLARDVTERCEAATTMASLGKIVTGRTPSPKQTDLWGGDLPFVTPGDLVAGNISVSHASRTLVADSNHGATVLPANSVLVTCIGSTVGKTAIARERCVTNQQINAICCPSQTAGFVYLASVATYDTIVANAGKQAVPIINKSTFSAIEVPALSQAEMIEISAMVDAIDAEIVAAQTSMETLHRTKVTLMSDLLSGRVRVPT